MHLLKRYQTDIRHQKLSLGNYRLLKTLIIDLMDNKNTTDDDIFQIVTVEGNN